MAEILGFASRRRSENWQKNGAAHQGSHNVKKDTNLHL
jgi:hypothetical protein